MQAGGHHTTRGNTGRALGRSAAARGLACFGMSLAALFVGGGGCSDAMSYSCESWCGSDLSGLVRRDYQAGDEAEARESCFDDVRGTCPQGSLPKCSCEEGSSESTAATSSSAGSTGSGGGECTYEAAMAIPVEECTWSVEAGAVCSGVCAGSSLQRCTSPQSMTRIGCTATPSVCCADGAHVCPVGMVCTADNECTTPECGQQPGPCQCLQMAPVCPEPLPEPPPDCCPAEMPYRLEPGCVSYPVYPPTQACADMCGVSL
jgi:hypothetical protein